MMMQQEAAGWATTRGTPSPATEQPRGEQGARGKESARVFPAAQRLTERGAQRSPRSRGPEDRRGVRLLTLSEEGRLLWERGRTRPGRGVACDSTANSRSRCAVAYTAPCPSKGQSERHPQRQRVRTCPCSATPASVLEAPATQQSPITSLPQHHHQKPPGHLGGASHSSVTVSEHVMPEAMASTRGGSLFNMHVGGPIPDQVHQSLA